jgi:hypothetical protein
VSADLPPPQDISVNPYFEVRERVERRLNRDFDSDIPDDRSDLLSRWRLGAELDLRHGWRAEAQVQFAHDLVWTPQRNFSLDHTSLSLAYVDGPTPVGRLTVGRQKIAIGSQRLVGPLEWANVPRSFDAARVRTPELDVFAASIGVARPRPEDARIAGVSHRSPAGLTNLFYKHDAHADGDIDVWTLNHWANRTAGPWMLNFEGALQGGKTRGKDHEAWALHARAGYRVDPRTTFHLEANAASGGETATTVRTFDNLYPTNHPFYGIMDLQSWRNMRELSVGMEHRVRPNVLLRATAHRFWLQDPRDAWYGAGGAPNRHAGGIFRDPTGLSGRHVGDELDLESVWTLDRRTTVSAGIAVFLPGTFVRNVAGSDDRQTWGFVQVGTRF